MIKWVVREVAERAGFRSARELAREADIHINTAYGVWNGTATMVGLSTIDRICAVLDVKPGQLFDQHSEPHVQRELKRVDRAKGRRGEGRR